MTVIKYLLSMLLVLICVVIQAQDGVWNGELSIQGIKLPIVFHFNPDGCTMDSPSQGANGIPAQKSILDDGTIKVVISQIGAQYEGKTDGICIKGTFTQNGYSFPLVLTKDKPLISRPQTPVPPFSYKEKTLSFSRAGYTFNGTLTLPNDCSKNTPVILMITGSGQQNRDEEICNHKPFAVIADALARKGIASFRYDDRGWNDSTIRFTDYTTNDFKQDAEAGIKMLRKHFSKVGVLGHSEGGTIALLIASEGKADFIISLAGMVVSGKETLLIQNRQALTSLHYPVSTVDSFCVALDTTIDEIAQGKKVRDISVKDVPMSLKPVFAKSIIPFDENYLRYFITVDASQVLSKITCPVLALNGTKDIQVDCQTNISILQKGLTHSKHTVKALEGLNHLFQHCVTGNIIEYQQIEETIAPDVLDMITNWIKTLK